MDSDETQSFMEEGEEGEWREIHPLIPKGAQLLFTSQRWRVRAKR